MFLLWLGFRLSSFLYSLYTYLYLFCLLSFFCLSCFDFQKKEKLVVLTVWEFSQIYIPIWLFIFLFLNFSLYFHPGNDDWSVSVFPTFVVWCLLAYNCIICWTYFTRLRMFMCLIVWLSFTLSARIVCMCVHL